MRSFLLILEIICSLVLIASVLLQSSNKAGLGVISGAAEQLAGNKARGMDVVFRKVTEVCAALFIILAIALVSLQ